MLIQLTKSKLMSMGSLRRYGDTSCMSHQFGVGLAFKMYWQYYLIILSKPSIMIVKTGFDLWGKATGT